ncbi:MAG: DUF3014 domain-containing protein [Hylemonella sp.]|nr:DUF3014 domain-containing protein [Hylemonella sp.]
MNRSSRIALAFLVTLALVGVVAWLVWPQPAPPAPKPVPVTQPVSSPADVTATPVPSNDPIRHPVQAIDTEPAAPRPLPALGQSDARLQQELNALVGRKNVQTFVLLESFVRRVVATVDNLGREHAAPSMWPLHPTGGRFATLKRGEGEVINPDNGQRYVPLVQFIESVDSRKAVQLYAALYPLFQQAYVELGYPKAYFNDRLVAVIDQLLGTPVIEGPLAVALVEVKGPIASERPWTRYEFADEKLQSLAAGQKMLLRTGPVNHRRLKAKLLEIRGLLTKAELPASVKP